MLLGSSHVWFLSVIWALATLLTDLQTTHMGSWAPHYFWPFHFASQKASAHSEQRRRRQASCPRRASGRVRSCLMGSAQWVMGHKFKRSAKLTESPALLSSPPTLMRASSCAAPVKSKSLLGAGRPGPHLCECLKQLFLWLWWKTFSQKPSWRSYHVDRKHLPLDDWCHLLNVMFGHATLSALIPIGTADEWRSQSKWCEFNFSDGILCMCPDNVHQLSNYTQDCTECQLAFSSPPSHFIVVVLICWAVPFPLQVFNWPICPCA